MAGTDFSHLTNDELIKGIKALDLPDYIRSKGHGIDVRETLAQMTEMTIQLGVNMGLSPEDALNWARKLQESVSQSEFDSWVATLLDGGPSIFMNTLTELQTTYPNGAAGVALVRETDPAKIYVWNGSSWEDFGYYQGIEVKDSAITSEKLADESVTPSKTNFITTGKNLFDSDPIPNAALTAEGRVDTKSIYENYSYIKKVEPNTAYTLSKSVTKALRIGESADFPQHNEILNILFNHSVDGSFTEATFTTGPDTNYIYCYLAFTEAPPKNIQLEKGSVRTPYEPFHYTFTHSLKNEGEQSDVSESKRVFVEKMNEKATELGMLNTRYNNASGVIEDLEEHYSTPEDMLKMGVHALGYEKLLKLWNYTNYDVIVEGKNPRVVNIETSVIKSTLDDHYTIIGGKTGTAMDFQNLWVSVEHPNGKDTLVGVVSGMHTLNRYQSAKELFDIAVAKMNGEDVSIMDIGCNYGIVGVLPYRHPFSTIRKGIDILWSKNAQDIVRPASTSKTMAVIVALDHITNFEEMVTITESDFVVGAGSELFPVGDIVKMKDLFYGAMLPSQNTLTETLRRVAGEKIIISRSQ